MSLWTLKKSLKDEWAAIHKQHQSGHLSNTVSLHLTSCLNTQLQFVANFSVFKQITNASSQTQTHFFLLFMNSWSCYVLFFALLVVGNMLTASCLEQETRTPNSNYNLWSLLYNREEAKVIGLISWSRRKKRSCQSTEFSFFYRVPCIPRLLSY